MKRSIQGAGLWLLFQLCRLRAWLRQLRVKLKYPNSEGVCCLATPVILYTTAGMPVGARANIPFYRPNTTNDSLGNAIANVVPFGSESSGGTQLGGQTNTYVVEDIRFDPKGSVAKRAGTYGEERDKSLQRQDPSLSMTVQMASAGTPTICPGDYILIAIGMAVSSTGSAQVPIANTRWFVTADGISMQGNQANKFSVTFEFDRENSSPNLKEF